MWAKSCAETFSQSTQWNMQRERQQVAGLMTAFSASVFMGALATLLNAS